MQGNEAFRVAQCVIFFSFILKGHINRLSEIVDISRADRARWSARFIPDVQRHESETHWVIEAAEKSDAN